MNRKSLKDRIISIFVNRIKLINKIYYKIKYPLCRIETNLPYDCEIGNYVTIKRGCVIKNSKLKIGNGTFINENTIIEKNLVSIGNYCSISSNVKIGLLSHPTRFVSTSPLFYSKTRGLVKENLYDESLGIRTSIENDVWIGANTIILGGVKIFNGAVIAAKSMVTKDVAPYAIVGGVPAKVIKYRFDNKTIEKLEKTEWYNLDIETLKATAKYFNDPQNFIKIINNN